MCRYRLPCTALHIAVWWHVKKTIESSRTSLCGRGELLLLAAYPPKMAKANTRCAMETNKEITCSPLALPGFSQLLITHAVFPPTHLDAHEHGRGAARGRRRRGGVAVEQPARTPGQRAKLLSG